MSHKESDYLNQKVYKNPDFLNSPEARNIRILCELTAPGKRFKESLIENTIVFFGSARSICKAKAEKNLQKLIKKEKNSKSTRSQIQDQLRKAEKDLKLSEYYDASVELSQKLTQWSMNIADPVKRFYICSGGGPGMMEASNLGAKKANSPSIGLNISLPFEQEPNQYQSTDISFVFHYFFIRKFWFAYLAKALVVFPGGFGTMDELFELLTLIQTKKIQKTVPIVLFGNKFWDSFLNFEALLDWGVISEDDLKLFTIMDDIDEAFKYLTNRLTEVYL